MYYLFANQLDSAHISFQKVIFTLNLAATNVQPQKDWQNITQKQIIQL